MHQHHSGQEQGWQRDVITSSLAHWRLTELFKMILLSSDRNGIMVKNSLREKSSQL